jgi:hypothetical protein
LNLLVFIRSGAIVFQLTYLVHLLITTGNAKEVVTDRDPDLDVTNLSYVRRLPCVPYQAGKKVLTITLSRPPFVAMGIRTLNLRDRMNPRSVLGHQCSLHITKS